MNFGQAIQAGFRNYANFNGRASRSEYWYWMLLWLIVALVDEFVLPEQGPAHTIRLLLLLVFGIPTVAVSARRLHDIDKSGWFQLVWMIPIVGWILLLVWGCRKGTEGPNRFGPDPLASAA
jgi:uncharacterized membrane protein YhaH (DUF805 family)